MAWPSNLQVALKEWASVCAALQSGRQIMLLRKGGIHDEGGIFAVEHNTFLFFPSYLHQKRAMLKSADQSGFDERASEPDAVTLAVAGVVTDVIQVPSRASMDAIDAEHVWAPPLIDMRFDYKPASPLYALLVRAYRLLEPVTIANTPAYAGCKSWVPLDQPIATGDAVPVLDDVRYEHRRRLMCDALA